MIKIYTDGACSGNPGKGGWGAVIINKDDNVKKISGSANNTTNNRMELMAVIASLKYAYDENINVFTDSKYVKNGMETWIINWKKNGWKTKNKQDVKNKDLWIELDNLQANRNIKWNWVKGHADDVYNNMADELARLAIKPLA